VKLFCVFQEGVYRHECVGVFGSIEKAKDAANRIAAADSDDYHSYDVFDFTLNEVGKEDRALYSVRRGEAEKLLGIEHVHRWSEWVRQTSSTASLSCQEHRYCRSCKERESRTTEVQRKP